MIRDKTTIFEVGGSKVIRIPMSILNDSQYPFEDDDNLIIEIKEENLIIKKRGEKNVKTIQKKEVDEV